MPEHGEVIEITDAMRDAFIDACIVIKDSKFWEANDHIRYAFRKWLHQFEGRFDYDVGDQEAGRLFERMQIRLGEIERWTSPARHIGVQLVLFPALGGVEERINARLEEIESALWENEE